MKSKVAIAEVRRPHGRRGPSQVHGIDILRFFCAVAVAFYHFAFLTWVDPRIDAAARARALVYQNFGSFAATGWVGVEVFFVISGYVIAYTANGRSPIAFFNSRILRLVPGVVACALIAVPALAYSGDSAPLIAKKFVRTILFFPNIPWTSGAFWTLGVEIMFYGTIMLLLIAKRYDRVALLAYALGLYSAVPWLAVALVPHPGPHLAHALNWFVTERGAELILVHHGVFFAIGMLVWLCHHDRMNVARIVALALFGVTALTEVACQANTIAAFMHAPIPATIACTVWIVAMLCIVLSLVFNEAIARRVTSVQGAIRAIGLSTFPFYLLHQPVGGALLDMGLLHGVDPTLTLWGAIAVNIALSFLVALLIEPYARGLLHRGLIRIESRVPQAWRSLHDAAPAL